jgi:hypothetical protein
VLLTRLDRLDRDLAERRAVVGATGEPIVSSAVSAVPISASANGGKIKQCCLCLAPAQYSLAFVISTLGIKPRLQKCSPVILLCDLCIHKLSRALAVASPELQDALKNRVYSDFFALNQRYLKIPPIREKTWLTFLVSCAASSSTEELIRTGKRISSATPVELSSLFAADKELKILMP